MRDSQAEQLIKQRISQAAQRGLPQLLINFFHYNGATVAGEKKIESSVNQRITEVVRNGTTLVFKEFKVSEDPVETYEYAYWAYEVMSDGRLVFGVEVKKHWAGGKPELKEITAYIPGAWEERLKELKAECDALTRQRAEAATAEKRLKRLGEMKDRLARFGFDDEA